MPQPCRFPMTPAQRERLDAMLPELRPLLLGGGISRGWLSERTGIPMNQLTPWLHALGAVLEPKDPV